MAGMAYFSKVRAARIALKERAEEILNLQIKIIKDAIAAGDFETAAKANQWLLEHMPEEDGERVVDISVDKPKQVEGYSGPSIQIGISMGGIPATTQKALPEVIDVKVDDEL